MLGGVLASVLQVGLSVGARSRGTGHSAGSVRSPDCKRIFSLTGTMRLGFGLVKVFVVSIVAAAVLWQRWDEVLRAGALDIAAARQIPGRHFA